MTHRICVHLALAVLVTLFVALARAVPVMEPTPMEVAPGIWMLPGGMLPSHEPDGNSVIFQAPAGLVVVDTGRHQWHRDAILALAHAQDRGILAIVNSHWHLDHVSGNPALRAAYPRLTVYASGAIDEALSGFLAASAKDSAGYLRDPQIPADMRDDIRGDLLTIERGAALRPDVVITASGRMAIAGRVLDVHLAKDAATAGDVWLYDERTKVAVLGDLVTLPAPFLDTACPNGWKGALAQIATTPFVIAIPGHGAPMSHPQFDSYRQAFETFVDCVHSNTPTEECAAGWASSVQTLLAASPSTGPGAKNMTAYYVDLLRANGGRSKYCRAR